jgi:YD repeat-containing protein
MGPFSANLDRINRCSQPKGPATHKATPNLPRHAYNAFGPETSVTDPLGHTATLTHDTSRHLTKLTDANGKHASEKTMASIPAKTPTSTATPRSVALETRAAKNQKLGKPGKRPGGRSVRRGVVIHAQGLPFGLCTTNHIGAVGLGMPQAAVAVSCDRGFVSLALEVISQPVWAIAAQFTCYDNRL